MRSRRTHSTITTGVAFVAAMAIVHVASVMADVDGAVGRALDRLENLDGDPLELPAPRPAPDSIDLRAKLTIARSIQIVEAELDTSLAVLTGEVLPLLSLARNYRHLGLRNRALVWYDRAETADTKRAFVDELLAERFEIALELGDSVQVAAATGAMLARDDAAAWSPALARALSFLASRPGTSDDAARWGRRIEALRGPLDAECVLELARLHQRRDDDAAAREHYRELVSRESRLAPRPLALALLGLADTELALGNTRRASTLLTAYRDHDVGRLGAWATYQLAGLAASAARYEEAEHLFRSLCEREASTPWRENACTRWAQMRELNDIEAALRPYGRSLRPAEGTR